LCAADHNQHPILSLDLKTTRNKATATIYMQWSKLVLDDDERSESEVGGDRSAFNFGTFEVLHIYILSVPVWRGRLLVEA
jgi:hypothetical protein